MLHTLRILPPPPLVMDKLMYNRIFFCCWIPCAQQVFLTTELYTWQRDKTESANIFLKPSFRLPPPPPLFVVVLFFCRC